MVTPVSGFTEGIVCLPCCVCETKDSLTICGLENVNFPVSTVTSIVAVIQTPDSIGILVTANYEKVRCTGMEYNKEICYKDRKVYLHQGYKHSTNNLKHCFFSLSCKL